MPACVSFRLRDSLGLEWLGFFCRKCQERWEYAEIPHIKQGELVVAVVDRISCCAIFFADPELWMPF